MARKVLSMFVAIVLVITSLTTVALGANAGTVLYDAGGIRITYQSYEIDKYGDFNINILIENNSAQNIGVQTRNESMSGYMIEGIISEHVAAGQKAETEITFDDSDLEYNHLSVVHDVEFSFHIFEEETWDDITDTPMVKLSFGGVNLNNGVAADTRPVTTFFNQGGIKVSYIDITNDGYGYYDVNFLIENNTQSYICVQCMDSYINGVEIYGIMSDEVRPGMKAYGMVSFSEDEMKEKFISTIYDVSFSLDIFNYDTYDTIYETDIYKIANGGVQGYSPSANPAGQAPANNGIKVVVNGNQVYFDQPPVAENGRTLVPLRAIFEALGATVNWDGATQTITSQRGNTMITLRLGSNEMYVSGAIKMLDVPAKAVNGRTLVPVRAISEAFGCSVSWDGNTQTVYVTQ